MSQTLELIANQNERVQRFFDSEQAYQEFCRKFVEEVTPDLEKYREARQWLDY